MATGLRLHPTEPTDVFVGIKLRSSVTEALDELAKDRGDNRSMLIREAISRYLADEGVTATA